MFKLFIIAAIVACANGYYNHGAVAHDSYYGNYGHAAPSLPLPALNAAHHGNIYAQGYGHSGAAAPAQTKIIQATYPGAAHKAASYSIGHPAGYAGAGYSHGPVNHAAAASYLRAPSALAAHAPLAYSHGPASTYTHSQYAVTEGPTNYAAHSRYAIATAPALSYGHQARYPLAHAAPIYPAHGLPLEHALHKIAYTPAISHMGYQNHAAHSYSW